MLNSASEIRIKKQGLQKLINKLLSGANLYWRYNKEVIYLVIDSSDHIDDLAFKRDGNMLLLDKLSLDKIKNKDIKEKIIEYLVDNEGYSVDEYIESQIGKSKKHLELEIDYCLMELHEYLKTENEKMADEIKCRLDVLVDQLNKYNK